MIELAVIMVEPEFESTIGSVARIMKNFGAVDLRLVNPLAGIGPDAHMWASHAQEVLDNVTIFPDLSAALEGVNLSVGTTAQRASSLFRILRKPISPYELTSILKEVAGKIAVVFGREGTGLNNDELQLCELTLTIQASPDYPTLNLSHAAAIIFHEIYAGGAKPDHVDILASDIVKGRILDSVQSIASQVDLPPRNRTLVMKAFKSAMARASLRAREASLLAGFFRRIQSQMDEKGAKVE